MAGDAFVSPRTIWMTFWVLLIVTVTEVALAIYWPAEWPRLILNLFLIFFTLVKAYFIVAEFMHLRYELRPLILTVLSPLILIIWFIIAFLVDGRWWGVLRQWLGA